MNIFKCTKCEKVLISFIPEKCECGFTVPVIDGVYQFTEDSPISIDGDGLKWLGYENVGENYEPGYVYNKDNEVGIGNSVKLAEYLGEDKIILDLGAGLGGSSISFALAGLKAIAVDISQAMMKSAVQRAKKHNVPENKIIFTRMNGYKFELADNSIDAVIAMDVLHQVGRPELMMEEIKRVLKPDGYFLKYGGGSLGYTEEQQAANEKYNKAYNDIESFYNKLIDKSRYDKRPFSSYDNAKNCVNENFIEFITIEDTGIYGASNMEWQLKMGIHKLKTKANGTRQLIPDEIHNAIWAKTEKYAKKKYGENYENITRYYNQSSSTVLYKRRGL